MDKRFGESDTNLSLEEKMFLRFQQERVKKVRNGSLFNLDANDTEVLTHKGQQLGESNIDDRDWVSSDEEGGGKLDKEVVNKLHFGGGMIEKDSRQQNSGKGIYGPADDEDDQGGPRKGRLEALQEIVMKSKLHKMQKKEAKEEQEDEREKLDKAFEHLFATSQIDITKPERGRRQQRDDLGELDELDAYDVSLREMAYEAKAQPSDRTKTDEEIAVLTREKIEELEKARIKRMRQVASPDDDQEAEAALRKGGGIRGRKVKHVTDDMIDEPAPKTKAAKVTQNDSEEEEEDGEDDEEGDEDDEEGDEDDEEEEDEDEEGDEDEDEDVSDEEMDYDKQPDEEQLEEDEEYSDDEESDSDLRGKKGGAAKRHPSKGREEAPRKKRALQYVDDGVNVAMPHKISVPADLEAFDELVEQYVRSDADMAALIDRILAWNSVHLPGAQGAENRNLMHNFMDVLLKHFVRVGDSLGDERNDDKTVLAQVGF